MSEVTFQVRPASATDLPAVHALTAELGYAGFDPGPYAATFAKILASSDHRLWVAERSDRLVGYVLAHAHVRLGLAGRMVSLDEIVVTSTARRQGVGQALVRAVEAFARGQGAIRLELTTSRNRDPEVREDFYGRCGFEEANSAVMRARLTPRPTP